ncbi:hypothetical protein ACFOOK_31385 [Micromonospora krabiensis]|nr:hypothetical protein [Micromonospora krabiensis]
MFTGQPWIGNPLVHRRDIEMDASFLKIRLVAKIPAIRLSLDYQFG